MGGWWWLESDRLDDDDEVTDGKINKQTQSSASGDAPLFLGHVYTRKNGERVTSSVHQTFSRETLKRLLPLLLRMPRVANSLPASLSASSAAMKSGKCVDRPGGFSLSLSIPPRLF